jgi:hypothetical protein
MMMRRQLAAPLALVLLPALLPAGPALADIRPPAGMAPNAANATLPAARTNLKLPVDVRSYGAKCDVVQAEDIAVATVTATGGSGQAQVVFAGTGKPVFVAGDVGKFITLTGAGTAGAVLSSTIASVDAADTVTLAANLATALSATAVAVSYGSNDAAAFASAITALGPLGGQIIVVGKCGVTTAIDLPALGPVSMHAATTGSILLSGEGAAKSAIVALAPIASGVLREAAVFHKNAALTNLVVNANGVADYAYYIRGGTGGVLSGDVVLRNAKLAELRLGDGVTQTQNFKDYGSYFYKNSLVMSGVAAPYNLHVDVGTDSRFFGTLMAYATTHNLFAETGSANHYIGTHVWGPAQVGYSFGFKDTCSNCVVNGASVTGMKMASQYVTITGGIMDFPALSPYTGICGIDFSGVAATTEATITGIRIIDIPASQYVCMSGVKSAQQVRAQIAIDGLPPYIPTYASKALQYITTNATPVVMTANGQAAAVTNIPLIDTFSGQLIEGLLVARNATDGTLATWRLTFGVRRGNAASTTAIDGSVVTAIGANTGFTAPTVTADTTNGAWQVNATGIAAKTIWWRFTYMASSTN